MEKFSIRNLVAQGYPFLIAGPCGVESRNQLLSTIEGLSKVPQVKAIRGGLWKPRTRPNSFEGMGEAGIPWMVEARDQFQLPIITEVAKAQHVEVCLKNNFDALWIGARTVANPFSVQEIADALKGVSIPIFIKNPIHPDLALWMGAIERIQNAGITDVAAIHRTPQSIGTRRKRNHDAQHPSFSRSFMASRMALWVRLMSRVSPRFTALL